MAMAGHPYRASEAAFQYLITPCSSLTITLSEAKSDNSIPGGGMKGYWRRPTKAVCTRLVIGRRLQSIALRGTAPVPQGGPQITNERLAAYRLGQVGLSAASHGARSGRRVRIGRDDDNRHRGTDTSQVPQQVEAAMARHAHVGNQAVEPAWDVF